jgi:hypothetical protein
MKRSRGRPCKPPNQLRWAAKQAGQKQYMAAEPCMRGHISKRFTSNNGCVACLQELRGKKYTGPRATDEKTPDKLQWLAHRKEARARYRRMPINQTGESLHAR